MHRLKKKLSNHLHDIVNRIERHPGSTDQRLSFEWSNFGISFIDLKVDLTTSYNIVNSGQRKVLLSNIQSFTKKTKYTMKYLHRKNCSVNFFGQSAPRFNCSTKDTKIKQTEVKWHQANHKFMSRTM